ncbi:unnamed protein product [Paramecium sonneborni]|uniref:Uncharacterized protein n=1 Tax=Paramecium sonneborni TaxID=65129 RepID=A0A8S1P1V3_9CILI|nr:unnamed protein product [Paramecium sonneborni]
MAKKLIYMIQKVFIHLISDTTTYQQNYQNFYYFNDDTDSQIINQELTNALMRISKVINKKINNSDVPLIQSSEAQTQDENDVILSSYIVKKTIQYIEAQKQNKLKIKKIDQKQIHGQRFVLSKFDDKIKKKNLKSKQKKNNKSYQRNRGNQMQYIYY